MRVRIGDTVYDSNDEPIMIILTPRDLHNLRYMAPDLRKYCSYPEGMDRDAIEKWMKEVD